MHNYQVLGLIGQGAYGVVLKAKNRITNKLVAIKKFKESDDQDQIIRKIILRQIKVLKTLSAANISNNQISHSNFKKKHHIVQLIQAFKKKGLYYLVFQYYDNNILQILEKSQHGIQRKFITKYIFQLLKGLKFMHQNNFVHRDIKPQNLLVNSDHIIKICDMGFARHYNSNQRLTQYVATRWYRAPQLLFGIKYNFGVDIWATGCLMAQLIDGDPLFPGNDEIDQIKQIQQFFGVKIRKSDEKNKILILQRKRNHEHPSFNIHSNLSKKYERKIGEMGVNLLKRMLQLNQQKRISANQCLNHPFFDEVRQQYEQCKSTPGNLKNQQAKNISSHSKLNKVYFTESASPFYKQKRQNLQLIQQVNQNQNYNTINNPSQNIAPSHKKIINYLQKKGQNRIHTRISSDFNQFSLNNWSKKFSKKKSKNNYENHQIHLNNKIKDIKHSQGKPKCHDLFENKTNRTQCNNSIKALLKLKNDKLIKQVGEGQDINENSYLSNFKASLNLKTIYDKSLYLKKQKSYQIDKQNSLRNQQKSIRQKQSLENLDYYRTSYDKGSVKGSVFSTKFLTKKINELKNTKCVKSTSDQNLNSYFNMISTNGLKQNDGMSLKKQHYERKRNKNEINIDYYHTNKIFGKLKSKYATKNQSYSKSVQPNNYEIQKSQQALTNNSKTLKNRLKNFKSKLGL